MLAVENGANMDVRIEYILKMELNNELLANIFEKQLHCPIPSLKYIQFLSLNRYKTLKQDYDWTYV